MRKFLIVFSRVTALFALLVAIGLGVLYGVVSRRVDFSMDDAMFSSAKRSSVISLYTDGGEGSGDLSLYEPVLREEVCYAEMKNRWADLEEIPSLLRDAFILIEDKEYYEHHGVNLRRSAMAVCNTITKRRPTFGASTITQQLIKNLSGDNELTVMRKLTEIVRALHLERVHTKDEILQMYLNIIPMGEQILGVKMAAREFFDKEPSELTVSEIALLVGITNAPTRYNPRLHPEAALKKRNTVIGAMCKGGLISDQEAEAAMGEPIRLSDATRESERVYSWFAEQVIEDVIADLAAERELTLDAARFLVYTGGLKIYTTEEPKVTEALTSVLAQQKNLPTATENGLAYAMIIYNSRTGNVAAIQGRSGEKGANRLYNLATEANITPGSSLKPIALYANLIESGEITPATVFDDVPSVVRINSQERLYPANYPRVYDGLIPVRRALALSKNTVAVGLYNMLGPERIYDRLVNDFEFSSIVRHGCREDGSVLSDLGPSPLALGQLSYGVTLSELTRAYTAFVRGGYMGGGKTYLAAYTEDGTLLIENPKNEKKIYSRECANLMCDMLGEVVESGTAKEITLKRSVDTAGKTGTSGDDLDRLFIGFTPYYTAGIWCGYEDHKTPIGRQSVSHLSLWDRVMRSVHSKIDERNCLHFSKEGLVKAEYCDASGAHPSDICSLDVRGCRIHTDYFLARYQPEGECHTHVPVPYDHTTESVATRYCPNECVGIVALLRLPDRAFPEDIVITDAEFMAYPMDSDPDGILNYDKPYFYAVLPKGNYIGHSKKKKQHNSCCYLHDKYDENEENNS